MRISQKPEPVSGKIPECFCDENGNCTRCGECCTTPVLNISGKDLETLREYVTRHGIKRQQHASENVEPGTDAYDTLCPLLAIDGLDGERMQNPRCLAYEARPAICRFYDCCMNKTDIDCDALKKDENYESLQEAFKKQPVNLSHELFPETKPGKGDMVIINHGIPDLHDQFLGLPFVVMSVKNDNDNIVCITRPKEPGSKKYIGVADVPTYTLTKADRKED